MPTEALDAILYRELSKVAAHDAIAVISPLLQELANHATNGLVSCAVLNAFWFRGVNESPQFIPIASMSILGLLLPYRKFFPR